MRLYCPWRLMAQARATRSMRGMRQGRRRGHGKVAAQDGDQRRRGTRRTRSLPRAVGAAGAVARALSAPQGPVPAPATHIARRWHIEWHMGGERRARSTRVAGANRRPAARVQDSARPPPPGAGGALRGSLWRSTAAALVLSSVVRLPSRGRCRGLLAPGTRARALADRLAVNGRVRPSRAAGGGRWARRWRCG